MSVTIYFPTKISPTETITLERVDWYPSSRPVEKVQSRRITPGGASIVYNLGLTNRFLNLIIRGLSSTDKINLENFIKNTAVWATNTFEFEDGQGNLFGSCQWWFDDYDFAQSTFQRFEETLLVKYGNVVIAEESLSFTITSSMTETSFVLIPLSFTITSSMTETNVLESATPWIGTGDDKLYLQSGGLEADWSALLKDSEDISGTDTAPSGISWDGSNTPWCGATDDKLYLQSGGNGNWGAALKDSEDISGIDNVPTCISWDGTNTPWTGQEAGKLYLQSGGQGTWGAVLKDSEDISAIDNLSSGISWDGSNTPWSGDQADKLYLQSGGNGNWGAVLKNSADKSGTDNQISGISWDGTDTLVTGAQADKLYKFGGFGGLIQDSEDVSGIDTAPLGISTISLNRRLGV